MCVHFVTIKRSYPRSHVGLEYTLSPYNWTDPHLLVALHPCLLRKGLGLGSGLPIPCCFHNSNHMTLSPCFHFRFSYPLRPLAAAPDPFPDWLVFMCFRGFPEFEGLACSQRARLDGYIVDSVDGTEPPEVVTLFSSWGATSPPGAAACCQHCFSMF